MNREKLVFAMLKPLDFGMGLSLGILKKLKLFDVSSQITIDVLRACLRIQYKLLNDLKLEDTENVPPKGGMIFATNHQSWTDVQAFGCSCPRRVHFVAKVMLKKWPILRHLIELNGGIYIHRSPETKGQTKVELASVIEKLRLGRTVCIFPEGTIPGEENMPRRAVEPSTGLLRGKTGAVRLAIEAQVPIIPVGISGTGKVLPPEVYPRLEMLRIPGKSPIAVKYGKPIYYEKYYNKDLTQTPEDRLKLRELTDELMLKISELVDFSMHYIPMEVPIKPLAQYQKVGVLLLHGFTSSLDAVNGLVPHLKNAAIDYEMPILRGHGTKYQDMRGTGARDWYQDAETALHKLCERVDKVVIVGFSMGGLLTIELSIEHADKIAGVITVAAAVKFADPLAVMTPILSKFVKYWPSPNPFSDPQLAQKNSNYPKFATDAFASLYHYAAEIEKKLPMVNVPIRVMQSKCDKVIAPISANIIYEKVASKVREIVWFHKSGHELLNDVESEQVFAEIMEFVLRFQQGGKESETTQSPSEN